MDEVPNRRFSKQNYITSRDNPKLEKLCRKTKNNPPKGHNKNQPFVYYKISKDVICHILASRVQTTQLIGIYYDGFTVILGAVSGKCPGFCKCLRFSNSGFATFSNSAGWKNRPALPSSNQRSMMVMATIINSILTLLTTSTL